MKSILKWLLLLPVAAVVVVFAINNRQSVNIMLDPTGIVFAGKTIAAPMYLVILAAVMVGVLAGGIASWLKQGKHRKAARAARSDALKLQGETERLRTQLSASDSVTAAYISSKAA